MTLGGGERLSGGSGGCWQKSGGGGYEGGGVGEETLRVRIYETWHRARLKKKLRERMEGNVGGTRKKCADSRYTHKKSIFIRKRSIFITPI